VRATGYTLAHDSFRAWQLVRVFLRIVETTKTAVETKTWADRSAEYIGRNIRTEFKGIRAVYHRLLHRLEN
jgi:hypothetical protein